MAIPFLNNVDFDQNQIINIVIDKRATDGAGIEGQFIYNTTLEVLKYHDGTQWIALGAGNINNVLGGDGLTATNVAGVVTLDVNVDDVTLEIASDIVRVKDLGISTSKIQNNAVTTIKVADNNITFAKIQDIPTMTVIGRVLGGTGDPTAISIISDPDLVGFSNTTLVTSEAVKMYVDSRIASIGELIGGFNASTSTDFPGTSSTVKGDYWYVTVAGTVQSVPLQVGDVLIAAIANPSPTNSADWLIIEGNRDQASTTVLGLVMLATNAEVQAGSNNTKAVTPAGLSSRTATETRTGIAEIATQIETDAGVDDTRIVTPLKLKTYVQSVLGLTGYAASFGNGAATSFIITHGLSATDVQVELYINATGQTFYADVTDRTTNTITINLSKPPATNAFRVTIIRVLGSSGAVPNP